MTGEPAPASGRMDGLEHVLPVRVYYEDTDFTGVVYHGAYVRFCERGRTEFLRTVGVHHAELLADPSPTAFAVIRMALDFRRAARIDDALVVRTRFERLKGPRMYLRQVIGRGEEVICEVEVEVACIDLAGRAKRPPPSLTAVLQPLLGSAP